MSDDKDPRHTFPPNIEEAMVDIIWREMDRREKDLGKTPPRQKTREEISWSTEDA